MSDEAARIVEPALYARMVALCERLATQSTSRNLRDECSEIMALVNPPVDPDVDEARRMANMVRGLNADDAMLVGIKRGRELAKAEQESAS